MKFKNVIGGWSLHGEGAIKRRERNLNSLVNIWMLLNGTALFHSRRVILEYARIASRAKLKRLVLKWFKRLWQREDFEWHKNCTPRQLIRKTNQNGSHALLKYFFFTSLYLIPDLGTVLNSWILCWRNIYGMVLFTSEKHKIGRASCRERV